MLHIDNRHHAMKKRCKAHAMIFGMIQGLQVIEMSATVNGRHHTGDCWDGAGVPASWQPAEPVVMTDT
jgi:hypothetical protein